MFRRFVGKKALVTGASRGIGRAITKALIREGAETFALARTQSNLDILKEQCPSVKTVCVNLADWEGTRSAVESVGCIDLLVNNAAFVVLQSFMDMEKKYLDRMIDVNLKAVVSVSQVFARGMIERGTGGAIVNVSSLASLAAMKDHSAYGASKAALNHLTRNMAQELGPHKIRVNAVNPSVVMTDMSVQYWSQPGRTDPIISKTPLGRFAAEEEISDTVLYLLSDQASMVHGVVLPVDGGYLI